MRTLVFDFDGTIADSFALTVDIFHELLKRSQALTADEIRTLRGKSAHEVVKHLGIRWYQIPRLTIQWRQRLRARLGEIHPFTGMGPTLHELHGKGHRLFIVSTNESQTIDRFLTDHGIRPYFEKIYGSVGLYGKARTLRKIMHEHNLAAEDCAYIGDEVRDIHAAEKVSMPVISVAWGYNSEQGLAAAHPHTLIRQPTELVDACNF